MPIDSPILVEDPETNDEIAEPPHENVCETEQRPLQLLKSPPENTSKRFKRNEEKEEIKLEILKVRLHSEQLQRDRIKVTLENSKEKF